VKRTLLTLAIVVLSVFAAQVGAQTRTRNNGPAAGGLMASLPESDAVAQIKLRQLLSEALPRIMGNNSVRLAEVNAHIETFKNRTGIDPRMFEQLAVGFRFSHPAEGVTKVQTVALANGTFNPAAMVAAGRVASNGAYREEKYQGKTIYVFKLEENIRMAGLFNVRIDELAAAPLDANVLALGDPAGVRAAIDAAGRSRKRANAELIALASRDPNAVIGFGGNVTEQLILNLDIGNAPIATDLSKLRQFYGSVGTSETNLELFLAARAVNAEAAKSLGDTLEGLKQFGALLVGRLSGARGVLAKSALANLQIVTQANELQIRTAVPQADLGPLMGN
jgi:hypothetical protein